VLDFTSALYLGFEHPSWSLAEWERLTAGRPAWLEDPPGARELQQELAALVGCERALVGPSTFHLYWDLFGILAAPGTLFLLDAGAYAIACWGAQRAASLGAAVMRFPSHDPEALRSVLCRWPAHRPVVVVDGYSPSRGEPAPLESYVSCVTSRGGLVVVDDTQGLGIFGHSQELLPPFGRGGGGSLRRCGLASDRVVLLASMAKAFGAPLAMVAGGEHLIRRLERESVTRLHCSPPSVAAIEAARRALRMNRWCGETRRARLARRIALFRGRLGRGALLATRDVFPVQILRRAASGAAALHRELLKRGVRTLLLRDPGRSGARVGFIITARHACAEIDHAASSVWDAMGRGRFETSRGDTDDAQSTELPGRALPLSPAAR
jgi:8-amino-7-oxononanoate synthase